MNLGATKATKAIKAFRDGAHEGRALLREGRLGTYEELRAWKFPHQRYALTISETLDLTPSLASEYEAARGEFCKVWMSSGLCRLIGAFDENI